MDELINRAEQLKYNVYNQQDIKVATITENKGKFSLEVFVESVFQLPIFLQGAATEKDLIQFLSKRVLPASRHGLDDILEAEGIKEYNWRKLIILNSGRTLTDSFYVLTEINEVESTKSIYTSVSNIEEINMEDDSLW